MFISKYLAIFSLNVLPEVTSNALKREYNFGFAVMLSGNCQTGPLFGICILYIFPSDYTGIPSIINIIGYRRTIIPGVF